MEIEPTGVRTSESRVAGIAATLAVLWFFALEFTIRYHRVGLFAAAGIGLMLMIGLAWSWRRHQSTWSSVTATVAHLSTSLGAVSFAGGIWTQHAFAAASAILFGLILRQRRRSHDDLRGRTMALNMAAVTWFGWYSLLSAGVYLDTSPITIFCGGALLSFVAAFLVWNESGLKLAETRWGLIAMGWFGAELFALTWWLPTALIVGSVIGTTITVLVVQASRHLWTGQWEAGRSRRYILTGASICLLALLSARWI